MKISVITVCLNAESTISRAIESVDRQRYSQFEHIVVDGASSDRTLEIVSRYSKARRIVVSARDGGIYDAMNKGLRLATGDVVCYLNADDFYASPDVLGDAATAMARHELDLFFGDVSFFNSAAPNAVVRRFRSDRFSKDRLAWGWMPAHPAMFMRRSIYIGLGGFNTSYSIAGDYEVVVRAFRIFDIRYRHIPEVLVRMQSGGVSNRNLLATIKLNVEVLRACRENGIKTNIFKILSKYPLKFIEFTRV